MGAMASQITSFIIVYWTVYPGAHKTHQSSASLAAAQGIPRWPVNSPHKWPVTRKMFPFADVIMKPIVLFQEHMCTSLPRNTYIYSKCSRTQENSYTACCDWHASNDYPMTFSDSSVNIFSDKYIEVWKNGQHLAYDIHLSMRVPELKRL